MVAVIVVIRNALTDNELRYVSRLPEMAGRWFILLIIRVIRYALLIGKHPTKYILTN